MRMPKRDTYLIEFTAISESCVAYATMRMSRRVVVGLQCLCVLECDLTNGTVRFYMLLNHMLFFRSEGEGVGARTRLPA